MIGVLALGLVLAGCNTTGRVKAVQSDVDAYIAFFETMVATIVQERS